MFELIIAAGIFFLVAATGLILAIQPRRTDFAESSQTENDDYIIDGIGNKHPRL